MTDPYRYLPCALHEALAVPAWAMCGLKGEPLPFVYSTRGPGDLFDVDLSHPAGWDHAVRALAAIRGTIVPQSASVAFTDAAETGEDVAEVWVLLYDEGISRTPEQRREALCRCICTALNLRVEEVFL